MALILSGVLNCSARSFQRSASTQTLSVLASSLTMQCTREEFRTHAIQRIRAFEIQNNYSLHHSAYPYVFSFFPETASANTSSCSDTSSAQTLENYLQLTLSNHQLMIRAISLVSSHLPPNHRQLFAQTSSLLRVVTLPSDRFDLDGYEEGAPASSISALYDRSRRLVQISATVEPNQRYSKLVHEVAHAATFAIMDQQPPQNPVPLILIEGFAAHLEQLALEENYLTTGYGPRLPQRLASYFVYQGFCALINDQMVQFPFSINSETLPHCESVALDEAVLRGRLSTLQVAFYKHLGQNASFFSLFLPGLSPQDAYYYFASSVVDSHQR